jgi:hypothetical protein
MPLVDQLKCSACSYATKNSSGSYLYTVANGAEVILGHPREMDILRRATGLEWQQAREAGLIRSKTCCICYHCAAQFDLDIDREEKKCISCGSHDVRSFKGSINEPCPSCRSGVLRLIAIGVS